MKRSAIAGLIWLTGFIFGITAAQCELHGWRVSPDKDACVVALGAAADLMSDGLQLQLWVLEERRAHHGGSEPPFGQSRIGYDANPLV